MKIKFNVLIVFFISIFLAYANGICLDEIPNKQPDCASITPTPFEIGYMDIKCPCRNDPRVNGKCFSFRGRASFWNGNITSLKIWMIGTHRVVGVRGDAPIPSNLSKILNDDLDATIYGIFTFCPYTPYKQGVMQFGCVDSVKIIKVIKSKSKLNK